VNPIDAQLARPHLTPGLRLLVMTSVATCRGAFELLGDVLAAAVSRQLERASFEETLLQSVLFCGFPRCVTAFETLRDRWPGQPTDAMPVPEERWREEGQRLFEAIYAHRAAEVGAMLRSLSPAFHAFVLESAYGRVLARPGLDPRTRELIAVGALAAIDQVPQLIAHGRGALRLGASIEEVRESLHVAVQDAPCRETWLARIVAERPPHEGGRS
jgi:4-carboxymuconolactone decarboxylase